MGIKGLYQTIADNAPKAIKQNEIKNFFGRKVAIDASMSLYQFLIAVRQQDGQQLMNDSGETTSHLMGMFYRTLRIVDNGIKPVYVFDGHPPRMKSGELAKRYVRREEAVKQMEDAKEAGDAEKLDKFSRRTVRVTKEQNEEAKKLLKLMGVPYVDAPCEAEAQCAALAKAGKVFAAASEDMDTLCFSAPILLRHLTFSEQRKMPITEVELAKALEGLELSMPQFVDLCILLGCDYLEPIKGVGPATAIKLIKEHKDLNGIVEFIKAHPESRYKIPEEWPFEDARELFLNPEVQDPEGVDLKWEEPDVPGLVDYLVKQKGFSEERVLAGAARLKKNLKTAQQGRLDGFFKVIGTTSSTTSAGKRKAADAKADKSKKAKAGKKK
ncbi:FEN-1 endonuclease Rad2 [Myxozyma melibiosi]|uniref:Flap endonuclease 1 n=1 Tax=Myxozyma melibiosi TaxID=54550 RepID=A0ABR1FEM9_9ASCO